MSTVGSFLICVIQVTIVAVAGILTSLAFRRWLRTSAGLPLAATLISVIALTLGAFSSWPSWLQTSLPAAPVHAACRLTARVGAAKTNQ